MVSPKTDRKARVKAMYRDDILAAALGVFSDVGYHETTMQQIAEQAGLAVGSLYNFFASKEVLYAELVSRFAREYRAVLDAALDGVDDEVEKIRSYIRIKGEFFQRNQAMARLYFGEARGQDFSLSVGMDAESRRLFDEFRSRLAGVFKAGMTAGVFERADPHYCAVTLQSLTNAFIFLWLRDPVRHPYHELVDTIATLVLRGTLSRRDDAPMSDEDTQMARGGPLSGAPCRGLRGGGVRAVSSARRSLPHLPSVNREQA